MAPFAWVEYLDTSTLLVVLSLVLCGLWRLSLVGRSANLPPGPKSRLFIGNAGQFLKTQNHYATLTELAKKYGEIVYLRFGPFRHMIVLTGHKVIREAYVDNGDVFSGRPSYLAKYLHQHKANFSIVGIIFGADWKELKKFARKGLSDFGAGKTPLEDCMKVEVDFLLAEVDATGGLPFDPKPLLSNAIANVMGSMIFGQRYDIEDEEFKKLLNAVSSSTKNAGLRHFMAYWWLPSVAVWALSSQMRDVIRHDTEAKAFVAKCIAEHRDTFDEDNLRDFIDIYLKVEKEKNESDALTDANMFQVIYDLLLAGIDTTSASMHWFMLLMIRNPDIQTKCRKEILQVIGSDRLPCKNDKGNLPYVGATVLEVHRLGISLNAISHVLTKSTTFRGYDLPEGCLVCANVYQSQVDPAVWKDPLLFNPDRWLDENNKLKTNPAFMAFGVGNRMCLGEGMANLQMFIFGATLLQRFELRMVDANNPPTTDPILGISRTTQPFKLVATKI